jgi:hypothetical protein
MKVLLRLCQLVNLQARQQILQTGKSNVKAAPFG